MAAAGHSTSPVVVAGGLFGVGLSVDNGENWSPINETRVLCTQDIKYETSSGFWGLAGNLRIKG